jgi:hypothetical protein
MELAAVLFLCTGPVLSVTNRFLLDMDTNAARLTAEEGVEHGEEDEEGSNTTLQSEFTLENVRQMEESALIEEYGAPKAGGITRSESEFSLGLNRHEEFVRLKMDEYNLCDTGNYIVTAVRVVTYTVILTWTARKMWSRFR